MARQLLDELYRRRDALKKVLRLATLIENLNQCLDSVMGAEAMGAELPIYAEIYYDRLSGYFRNISSRKAETLVRDLQPGIRDNLHLILKLTCIVSGSKETFDLPKSSNNLMDFVTNFADRAELLVGLWVLLFKRGTPAPRLELGADPRAIATRIKRLEEKERQYRKRVRESVLQMQEEVDFFLRTADPTDPQMRAGLQQMQAELEQSLRHIDNQGRLTDLPMAMEQVDLGDDELILSELRQGLNPPPASAHSPAGQEEQPTAQSPRPETQAPGLYQRLNLWLDSPLRVGWSDVAKMLKKKEP
ncbi:hypothetical protein D5125_16200 [Magnetovirga frankeli]|uniref:hypothetical protein n=1 Tax=Magnetovirga frankeli TaxID=947516 RepID=UPI0012935AD9|nr:hypothetical protein D5125_16200 [gamma proteobacterium SS-5]